MYDILGAIETHDIVYISTDYDADGCLAAATAISVMQEENIKYKHFISTPKHPRGVNKDICDRILEDAKENRYERILLITGDHGSSDYDNFNDLKEQLNITIVVTDHHEVPNKTALTNSTDYVLNPKYSDECTPWLCGAAVMWQLLEPLTENKSIAGFSVIANIVDMMSMADEDNRKFYHENIMYVQDIPLVQAILKEKRKVEAHDRFIAMNVGAVLNSPYRVNHPEIAVGALLGDKINIADALSLNALRKKKVQDLLVTVDKQIKANKMLLPEMMMTILEDPSDGVFTGLVAGRINGDLSVPTFVLAPAGNVFKGSFRTNQEIDALSFIQSSGAVNYAGGHQRAFGFTVNKTPQAIDKLVKAFKGFIHDNDIVYSDVMDAIEEDISNIDNIVRKINAGRPYGNMNKYPTYRMTGSKVTALKEIRNGMFLFQYGGVSCISFSGIVCEGDAEVICEVEIDKDAIQLVVSKIIMKG